MASDSAAGAGPPTEVAMLLTCPNCDTAYEVPDGMVPAAGRHVQCTSCHTRWFARGTAGAPPSEDQIVTRLEARAPRGKPAAEADSDRASPEAAAPPPVIPLRPVEARPVDRPAVPRPGEISASAPAPRAAPRLDLGPPAAVVPAAPPPARSSGFGLGLAFALLLFLLALGAYDLNRELAAEVPAAAPALADYVETVDDLRDRLEEHIAPLRARLAAARG